MIAPGEFLKSHDCNAYLTADHSRYLHFSMDYGIWQVE